MKHRPASFLPAAFALAFLGTGCTGVYVTRPIGDQPHALVSSEWEGTWVAGDSALVARVDDSVGGRLTYSTTQLKDGKLVTESVQVVIRESGAWLFATIIDETKPDRYEWARIKRHEGGQLLVWLPDRNAFRALVQGGKLKGRLPDKDTVVLDPLTADDLKALASGALGVPFVWDVPLVLRRPGQ